MVNKLRYAEQTHHATAWLLHIRVRATYRPAANHFSMSGKLEPVETVRRRSCNTHGAENFSARKLKGRHRFNLQAAKKLIADDILNEHKYC